MKKKNFASILCLLFITSFSFAQENNDKILQYIDSVVSIKAQAQVARNSKFLITGSTNLVASFSKDQSSFSNISLVPILLWKPHQNILVEAELEIGINGGETSVELGYADAAFFINNFLTIRTGKFISPFGIFQDRLHPSWINKLPTFPVGTGEDDLGVGPTSEIGVDFSGGIQLGSSKMNYRIFLANGAQLITDPAIPEFQGMVFYGNATAVNKKLTMGGRFGLLPFSNSSLELGVSYRNGSVGNADPAYNGIGSQMYALDFTYIKQLSFIKGIIDVKAQYNNVKIDNVPYVDPTNPLGTTTFTFDNKRSSYFAQAAYRPNMSQSKFLKKIELVYRNAGFTPPVNFKALNEIKQDTYGLDYWFNWRTVLKAAYQSQKDNNVFFLQVAVGF